MPELLISSTVTNSGIATTEDAHIGLLSWSIPDEKGSNIGFIYVPPINVDDSNNYPYERSSIVDLTIKLINENNLVITHVVTKTSSSVMLNQDVTTTDVTRNKFEWLDSPTDCDYYNVIPSIDNSYQLVHRGVHLLLEYDNLITPLSPVGSVTNTPWELPNSVDIDKSLTYGYSINNFLVGGSTDTNYPVDEAAVNPPEPPPVAGEVITFVNVINVVVLPERTPISFTNLSLSIDLDSIAWVFNFDIADQASLNLIKPQGAVVKEVEIDINGEKFVVFIGKTSTSTSATDTGGVQRRIKCTGWSATKQLTYPYSSKKSHTENSSSTPSGILNSELTGTGFTGTWDSPSWTLPANVFNYIDKAPLAAISELVLSIGSIIVPHPVDKSFSVKPRYPISPWNWSTATPDLYMSESQFFTIDTEWVPAESPDSIYVYGEEQGVGVKCVKQGTAGLVTLPTIVDKHITDVVAGAERGRIEVSRNGFKEIIPITTYLSETGIIMPHMLIEVTDSLGGTWRGMVIGVSLTIKRVGNAIVQSINVERHYD